MALVLRTDSLGWEEVDWIDYEIVSSFIVAVIIEIQWSWPIVKLGDARDVVI